jgi:hypothetical protein
MGSRAHAASSTAEPAPRRPLTFAKTALIALLLSGVLASFYRATLDDYFFHDDFVFLDRATLSSPSDLIALFSIERNQRGLQDKSHSYRPLSTNLYFGLVQKTFGLEPRAFHLINLLTLAGIGTLLVVLLVHLGLGLWGSLALAVIYASGSINHETQLWIAVFQELSFALLELLAILIHIRSDRSSWGGAVAVLGLFLLALLCKEMALSLPAILLCWELVVRRSRLRDALTATLPLWIAAAVYVGLRSAFLSIPFEGPYAIGVGWFLLANLGSYLDWSVEGLCSSADWRVELALLALAAVGFRSASQQARRLAAFGVLWFLLALGPVIFMPSHVYRYYLVFPVLGLVTSAAALIGPVASRIPRKELRACIALVLALGFAFLAHGQFEKSAARRERQTSRSRSILVQLRALHPELPDYTHVYLSAPGNFNLRQLLKDSGAALRVVYGNSTLRAEPLTKKAIDTIGSGSVGPILAFTLGRDGTLREHPKNPPIPRE